MKRWLKSVSIIVGALVCTTLGISASDTLQGVSGSLVSMALQGTQKTMGCGSDSTEIVVEGNKVCIDIFEARVGESCVHSDPKNLQETEQNLNTKSCAPISRAGGVPWRFVSLSQAQRACALAGKRLLTNEEWYRAALGTQESACYVAHSDAQGPRETGESECRSSVGVYDMVGNVWEWVDAQVESGVYGNRELPSTGHVVGVDINGIALATGDTPDYLYGEDYFWYSHEGVRGMLRGGFYGSGKDGGLYAVNASVDLGFGSTGVGFRCVRSYPGL